MFFSYLGCAGVSGRKNPLGESSDESSKSGSEKDWSLLQSVSLLWRGKKSMLGKI